VEYGRGDRPDSRIREETTVTQYLIMFNDEWVPELTAEEVRQKGATSMAVIEEMQAAGVFVFGDGGLDRSTAVFSVEAVDGTPVFTDGPYVETKEHLGGFTVVDVPDDAAARYWAGKLATALEWPQEVHRFPTFEEIVDGRAAEGAPVSGQLDGSGVR
jgi:hypothetical protein